MIVVMADEGVPPELCSALVRRGCRVIGFPKEWKGLADGTLLAHAAANGAQVFLTRDRNIAFQNDLANLFVGLVVLPIMKTKPLIRMADEIAQACQRVSVAEAIFVEPPP
jgi:hypothetical protein